MDDRDDAESLGDEDFLAIEPSPNHEVVYQPPMAPPPPDARTIETARVKIATDPERAALAKQTTVKIITRTPPPPMVTPPEVRIAYVKRSRRLFIASMVLLGIAGVIGGIYVSKGLSSPPVAASSVVASPTVVPPSTSTSTSASTSTSTSTSASASTSTVPSASATAIESASPRTSKAGVPVPRPSVTAPIGPPVF